MRQKTLKEDEIFYGEEAPKCDDPKYHRDNRCPNFDQGGCLEWNCTSQIKEVRRIMKISMRNQGK